MADIGIQVQTLKFNLALKEMQRRLSARVAPARVIQYEAGKVMELALRLTDRATRASIMKSQRVDRGSSWRTFNLGKGNQHFNLAWRYPNNIWNAIQLRRETTLQQKISAIGLSKKIFWNVARKMGIEINAPGYVSAAKPEHPEDVSVKQTASDSVFIIEVNIGGPLLFPYNSIAPALFSAIARRRKAIEEACRRGTFNELRTIAKQFPGLVVTGG